MNQENQKLLQRIRKQENKKNVMTVNQNQKKPLQDLMEHSQRTKVKQAAEIDRQNVELLRRINSQKSITNSLFENQPKVKQRCDQRFIKNLGQQVTPSYQDMINKSQQTKMQEQKSISKICANEGSMSPMMILDSMSSGFEKSSKKNMKQEEKKDINLPSIQNEGQLQNDKSMEDGEFDFVVKR